MRIRVRVVARARKPGVEQLGAGSWRVAVAAAAQGGKANAAVVEALARRFDVPKGSVKILRGETSRLKIIEILP